MTFHMGDPFRPYRSVLKGLRRGCRSWDVGWFTAMFLQASWSHILANMLFLVIFGKNVEDAFAHWRYLAFYIAGGLVAASP